MYHLYALGYCENPETGDVAGGWVGVGAWVERGGWRRLEGLLLGWCGWGEMGVGVG